jgi:hypothetical protein
LIFHVIMMSLFHTAIAVKRFILGAILFNNFVGVILAKYLRMRDRVWYHGSQILFNFNLHILSAIWISAMVGFAEWALKLTFFNDTFVIWFDHFFLNAVSASYLFATNQEYWLTSGKIEVILAHLTS